MSKSKLPPTQTDIGIDAVREFAVAFKSALPSAPSIPDEPQIQEILARVASKMKFLGQELKEHSALLGGSLILIRLQLIQEELAELAEGLLNRNLTECLDALSDLTYVVDGAYLSFGLGHLKLPALEEVHNSNMSKLDTEGNPIIDESGRVVKGPNYVPPNLSKFFNEE